MANQYTKFQVSSFSRSGDILGENKNSNWLRDHKHAHFSDDCRRCAWTSYDSALSNVSYLKSLRSLITKI